MDEPQANDCGCCTGIDTETPALIKNTPGLPLISYRTGDYSKFRESLLAKLSSSQLPALAHLSTREETDFTIALCEAAATMLDVLTFYQERIANENYLRTATERTSLLELSRLIGYTPLPGVAASTYLAFTLQESPGAPSQAAEPVTIPVGTRVQSVPGPDEQAQTFETVEAVKARVEWNAIPVQTTIPWVPKLGDTDLWLEGVANQIQLGDVLLLVGEERKSDISSDRWDLRLITSVDIDRDNNRTRLSWSTKLAKPFFLKSSVQQGVEAYVFRQRAALFGHNAPDPRLMSSLTTTTTTTTTSFSIIGSIKTTINTESPQIKFKLLEEPKHDEWADFKTTIKTIDLDSSYSKITPDSWFALVSNNSGSKSDGGLQGEIVLYKAKSVAFPSLKQFGLTGKSTHLEPDVTNTILDKFDRRKTLVLAQSELLLLVPRPIFSPIYGNEVVLASLHTELTAGQILAISGKRQRLVIQNNEQSQTVTLQDGTSISLTQGDSLILITTPELQTGGVMKPDEFEAALANQTPDILKLQVQDRDGRIGTLIAPAKNLGLEISRKKDPEIAEIIVIDSIKKPLPPDRDHTTVKLKSPLHNCFERASVRINANVAKATHGETVNEILGSGDARLRNASFMLKQSPLTYVSATTPSGRQTTLRLRVSDMEWKEKPTLFQQDPHGRVYTTLTDADAHTTVRFGDGKEGGLLPSGDHNIRAIYRKGLGLAGNVPAGKLSTLLTRPLGVSGVINPEPANGGADGEKQEALRTNAPITVKTLDRVVSIQDYSDFACTFAGIAKAHAFKIDIGPARGIFLTVAAEEGALLSENSETLIKLITALRNFGDPLIPLRVVEYNPITFHLSAAIKLNADADPENVLPEINRVLHETFGFDRAEFGQVVAIDYVLAVIQSVRGVDACFLNEFYRLDAQPPANTSKVIPRLAAAIPVASHTSIPLGAELLMLDSGAITLELMI